MKRFFTYCDIMLDSRGRYTPSHTIYIPKLIWKAEVFDEVKLWIETPNSLLNFWYVEILDESINDDITTLFSLPNMHWIREITNTEAKQLLLDNWYIEIDTNIVRIREESIDDITWETIPEITINFN